MAISYPLALPPGYSVDVADMTLVQRNVVGVSESPFTFEQQVFRHQAQRWEVAVMTNPLTKADAEPWRAWFSSLGGRYGTFLMGDPTGGVPRGSALGDPKFRVDSQSGLTIDFYDGETSVNSWLLPGDYVQVGSQSGAHLHRVLNTVTTNASGAGLIEIWPRLRASPLVGTSFRVTSAVGVWRLLENAMAEEMVAPGLFRFSFQAAEAM